MNMQFSNDTENLVDVTSAIQMKINPTEVILLLIL